MATTRARLAVRPAALGLALGIVGVTGATIVAVGWLAHVPALVRSHPGPATVSFNGALCLAALAAAVVALSWRSPTNRPAWVRRTAGGLATLAGILAAGSLLEELAGRSLGLDRLFVVDHYTPVGHPGRMAPETALAVLLLALALMTETWRPGRTRQTVWLSNAAGVVSLVATTELAGSSQQLFGLLNTSRVAWPAVLLLSVIVIGLHLAISDRAGTIWALWVDPSVRASMLRAFVLPMPVIALIPLVIGTALIDRNHPGTGRIVAEVGTATLAAMVLANAWVGSRSARRMTDSLDVITASAHRIAGGDLATPMPNVSRDDEIGELAEAFDRMRADLHSQARIRGIVGEASALTGAAPDLATAFEAFAQRLGIEVAFGRAAYLRPDETGNYRVEAVAGPAIGDLAVGMVLPADDGVFARLAQLDPAVIDDILALPRANEWRGRRAARGTRSLLTVPTVAIGQVQAVFSFASSEPGLFGPAEAELLRAAVREVAAVFDMLVHLKRERAAVDRLEEIDRQKNEFVGMVAHDLRSPMGVVTGFADTLRTRWDVLSVEQRDEFLGTISRNVMGMSAMVEDMLDVARIESGDYSCSPSVFRLDAIVEQTTTEVVQSVGEREVVLNIEPDLPLAKADQQRVWQVLTNILANACKFSGPGEPLTVTVAADDGMLRVAVTDRGLGIAAGDQLRVFEKFTRLPPPPGGRRGPKGVGLGLYISKLLTEAQGGTIGVSSTPGTGSTFWFTVPAASSSDTPTPGETIPEALQHAPTRASSPLR